MERDDPVENSRVYWYWGVFEEGATPSKTTDQTASDLEVRNGSTQGPNATGAGGILHRQRRRHFLPFQSFFLSTRGRLPIASSQRQSELLC
jgi:hypothetical protein